MIQVMGHERGYSMDVPGVLTKLGAPATVRTSVPLKERVLAGTSWLVKLVGRIPQAVPGDASKAQENFRHRDAFLNHVSVEASRM